MPVMKRLHRQPGREATRARIVAAALELFARDGYEQTTVRRIAAACGLTDAALYYYFDSKQKILDCVLQECWDERRLWQPDAPAGRGPVSRETIDALVDWTLDGIARNAAVMRLVARCCLAGDLRAKEIREARQARWRTAVRRRLGDEFCPDDAHALVETLLTLMVNVGMEVQIGRPDSTAEAINEPSFRAHVRGLAHRALPIERLRVTAVGGA